MDSWFGLLILWCIIFAFYLIYFIIVYGKKVILPKDIKKAKYLIEIKGDCWNINCDEFKCPLNYNCPCGSNSDTVDGAKKYIKERGYE